MIPKSTHNYYFLVKSIKTKLKKVGLFVLFQKRLLWSISHIFCKNIFCFNVYFSCLFFGPIVRCARPGKNTPKSSTLSSPPKTINNSTPRRKDTKRKKPNWPLTSINCHQNALVKLKDSLKRLSNRN